MSRTFLTFFHHFPTFFHKTTDFFPPFFHPSTLDHGSENPLTKSPFFFWCWEKSEVHGLLSPFWHHVGFFFRGGGKFLQPVETSAAWRKILESLNLHRNFEGGCVTFTAFMKRLWKVFGSEDGVIF